MTMIMMRRPDVGTLSVAAAAVLGFQAFRVFTSNMFWVVGETSDRVLLAALVFGALVLWGAAGLLARFVGIAHGRRIAIVLLAGMAVVGQASGSPGADAWIGALGTIAFGWVLALWVASVGRAAGQGLALGVCGGRSDSRVVPDGGRAVQRLAVGGGNRGAACSIGTWRRLAGSGTAS